MSELPPLCELRVAIKTANPVLARRALAANPDLINHRDDKGATPLHWAAGWQHLSLVVLLLEAGANPTLKNTLGYTPRDAARWNGEYANGAYTDICLKIVERLEQSVRAA